MGPSSVCGRGGLGTRLSGSSTQTLTTDHFSTSAGKWWREELCLEHTEKRGITLKLGNSNSSYFFLRASDYRGLRLGQPQAKRQGLVLATQCSGFLPGMLPAGAACLPAARPAVTPRLHGNVTFRDNVTASSRTFCSSGLN